MEQRATGTLQVWAEPFTSCEFRRYSICGLDPYERADITSNTYYDWLLDHAFMLVPAQAYVGQVYGNIQGVSTASKGSQFYYRPGDGTIAGAGKRKQVASDEPLTAPA